MQIRKYVLPNDTTKFCAYFFGCCAMYLGSNGKIIICSNKNIDVPLLPLAYSVSIVKKIQQYCALLPSQIYVDLKSTELITDSRMGVYFHYSFYDKNMYNCVNRQFRKIQFRL